MDISKDQRTPTLWKKKCLEILKKINPDYRLNKNMKGKFIEYIRQDESGAFVSLNFIRIREVYHLCFAISLTCKPTTYLNHPMIAGSRFDHNTTIYRLFLKDLNLFRTDEKCPKGIWSFGEWKSNTMERLESGLSLPDEYLYPYYRTQLHNGKERLLELFKRAKEFVPHLKLNESMDNQIKEFGINYKEVQLYRPQAINLNMLDIAKGSHLDGFGLCQNLIDLSKVPIDVIIMNNLEVFILEKDRLSDIIKIIELF